MSEIYDALIIGGGVIGCSIARYLSRFQGKFIVLEKHNDVGNETSSANSAIVHSGYDPKPGTLKAKFNVDGCKMMQELCEELDVPYFKTGSLTVALNDEDITTLRELKERGETNGVECRLLTREETIKIEPNINPQVKASLLCPAAGIVDPFNLTVSLMENAMDNGVQLALNQEVTGIKKIRDGYEVTTKDGNEYRTKVLINASGVHCEDVTRLLEEPDFKIIPTKGEYVLLDHFNPNYIKHTLFMCPTKVGKGVLVSPTTSFNYIVGPSAEVGEMDDTSLEKDVISVVKEKAKNLVLNIPYNHTVKGFVGIRANNDHNDFIIEDSRLNKNFINVSGIMSPGLASSPAIGLYISNLVRDKLDLVRNANFNARIKPHLTYEKGTALFNKYIQKDPRYGHFICRCERVSEGQVIDVIHRNCGATTVKGVKKRTRAGFGKCQGGMCQEHVLQILARELNLDPKDVNFNANDTEILLKDSKEGK